MPASKKSRSQTNTSNSCVRNINERLRKTVSSLGQRCDPKDRDYFYEIAQLCIDVLDDTPSESIPSAINILLDCATYHENIGESKAAYSLGNTALLHARRVNDLLLQRRCHNALGAFFTRLCDFTQACTHMKLAHQLATRIGDPLFILASSANTVALLESMGLLHSARQLALKICEYPHGTCHLDYLHLVNANNGIRICHALDDLETADVFLKIASENLASAQPALTDITLAYHRAAKAVHMARKGKLADALEIVNDAINEIQSKSNVRIKVLLHIALAEVHLVIGNYEHITESRERLAQLLDELQDVPSHYEELVRILIRLHSISVPIDAIAQKKRASKFLRLLREHLVVVKHKCFFSEAATTLAAESGIGNQLINPAYEVPSWINEVEEGALSLCERDSRVPFSVDRKEAELFSVLDDAPFDASFPERTPQFNVAENWAVAAEFASGGNGRHCFQVGRLAGAIAMEKGLSNLEARQLELACRLHDIGKAAIAFTRADAKSLRALGRFSVVCEHAMAGASLLEASNESILQLGARVAKSHHEWWNGCGYPLGLKGEDIPLEGRICRVAEEFFNLIDPVDKAKRWTVQSAAQQIQSMAGIQVDPSLISAFLNVISNSHHLFTDLEYDVGSNMDRNQLIEAKRRLYDAVELAN